MSFTFKTPKFLHPLLPNLIHPLKSPTKSLYFTSNHQPHKILCINNPNKFTDSDLASDFAAEVHRLNTQLQDTDTAMKTSKQLLFSDFCNYLNLNPDDVKRKWTNLSNDEKLGLVKGFVSDWGLNFHPLSPKSVRDLIEEFVGMDDSEENQSSDFYRKHDDDNYDDDSLVVLPKLKKLFMGFSNDN